MNINEVPSAPRSPWQRAYVERIIGSIREECPDHVIIFDEELLPCTLSSSFSYYRRSKLHLSQAEKRVTLKKPCAAQTVSRLRRLLFEDDLPFLPNYMQKHNL
jgi:hypothetical protein